MAYNSTDDPAGESHLHSFFSWLAYAELLRLPLAQLPDIVPSVLYYGVPVNMSGNRIEEQVFESREEPAMTPTVQGEILVYYQDKQEQSLTVGSAAWFAWLETASTFAFVSETGRFTARREQPVR